MGNICYSSSATKTATSASAASKEGIETVSTDAKRTVLVLGSSGYMGVAALRFLASQYADTVTIKAGVRDVNSSKNIQIQQLKSVEMVTADMSKPETLPSAMKGVHTVFIVVPGHADRTKLALTAIKACEENGIKHMVVLSVVSVVKPGTIFGDQFIPIEEAATKSSVPYTIVRLPMFMENVLGQLQSIQSDGVFYTPLGDDAKYNCVSLADLGEAVAKIMANPKPYKGKTFKLTGGLTSEAEIAAAFAASLNKEVKHVQVPYEAGKEAMMGMGMPEWQVDGVIELLKMVETGEENQTAATNDIAEILGRPPSSPSDMVKTVIPTSPIPPEEGPCGPLMVLGASGFCGVATLRALSAKLGGTVPILAGVRNVSSEKNEALKALNGVELTQADMSKPDTLAADLKGAQTVFVVVPGHEDRAKLALAGLQACKEAGVKHVVMLSVMTAVKPGTIFGDQFIPIEEATRECGLNYTIVRLPMFMENVFGQLQSIQSDGVFYTPLGDDAKYNCVALNDVGEAVAEIMAAPAKFNGKTFKLTGGLTSEAEIAAAFAASLNKEVKHVQVPYEAGKEAMMGMGMPEWQVDGVIELLKMVEAGDETMCAPSQDMSDILGKPPSTPWDLVRLVCN